MRCTRRELLAAVRGLRTALETHETFLVELLTQRLEHSAGEWFFAHRTTVKRDNKQTSKAIRQGSTKAEGVSTEDLAHWANIVGVSGTKAHRGDS